MVISNQAVVNKNFTVQNGKQFIQAFLTGSYSWNPSSSKKRSVNRVHQHDALRGESASSSANPSIVSSAIPVPSVTGYPQPVLIHSGLAIGGWYLEGDSYDDVAVLGISNYGPTSPNKNTDPDLEFQEVTVQFLKRAVAANKKKLIVDIRANPGGHVVQGFDTFKQLFPQIVPFGASRLRAHEGIEIISAAIADIHDNATLAKLDPKGYRDVLKSLSEFDYHSMLTVNNTAFTSFKDMYGPDKIENDFYTAEQRYNVSAAFFFASITY